MGPYASQMLADFGAEVIKVEPPEGDAMRWTGPSTEEGMAAMFLGCNRSKQSVVLDLKTPDGRGALVRLVETAHVFLHNLRPQKTQALGVDADTLRRSNPRLVYAGLHGFSAAGPYRGNPAYDDVIQGLSGLASLARAHEGQPAYLPTVVADKVSGLYAAVAILAAVRHSERTGEGVAVEVPMFESTVSFTMVEHLFGEHFIPPLAPCGYPRVLADWRRPHKTSDGYLCVMPYTDRHWRELFQETGHPELVQDARFASQAARTQNIAALYENLARIIKTRSTADWLNVCDRLDVPAAPVQTLQSILADPHLLASGYFVEVEDPSMGRLRFPGVPVQFDGQKMGIDMPPRLGEHTRTVLGTLDLPKNMLERLMQESTAASEVQIPQCNGQSGGSKI
jgi:crotonobetainyl-CoA:carnitine CoA-transferase CaiB-like acyl-CoA transferase